MRRLRAPFFHKAMHISSIRSPSVPGNTATATGLQPLPPAGQVQSLALSQAQQNFGAALRRASRRGAREGDDVSEGEEAHIGAAVCMPLAPPASVTAAATPLQGSTNTPVAHVPTALPDAVPVTGNSRAIGSERQWRVSVPLDNQAKAHLAMRLVNTHTGHWQMRLATDTHTRQQLNPHLDRLREKLHQHSQGQLNDLGFDEDTNNGNQ